MGDVDEIIPATPETDELDTNARSVLDILPHQVKPLERSWKWVMSPKFNMTFCGLMKHDLFLQSDVERNAVLHCLSHQIASGSWDQLVDILTKNSSHKLDSIFQLSDEKYFILQVNMFLMGVKHLNFFCQILEKVFVPSICIESIFMLEQTLNTIVVNLKAIQSKKPIENMIAEQSDEVRSFMFLKRYRSLSDEEIKTSFSVKL